MGDYKDKTDKETHLKKRIKEINEYTEAKVRDTLGEDKLSPNLKEKHAIIEKKELDFASTGWEPINDQ